MKTASWPQPQALKEMQAEFMFSRVHDVGTLEQGKNVRVCLFNSLTACQVCKRKLSVSAD